MRDNGKMHLTHGDLECARLPDGLWKPYKESKDRGDAAADLFDKALLPLRPWLTKQLNDVRYRESLLRHLKLVRPNVKILDPFKERVAKVLASPPAVDSRLAQDEDCIGFITRKLIAGVSEEMDAREVDSEAAADVRPQNWAETMKAAGHKFGSLVLASDIVGQLQPSPFKDSTSTRILELLSVLQATALETNNDSSLTERGRALLQQHFVGERAWFTDESESNKRSFHDELTFADPIGSGNLLFCPWHGKISIDYFRIHFEWPRPKSQRVIKVVYIGPKITKG